MKIRPLNSNDNLEELTSLLHRAYKQLVDQGMFALASHQDVSSTERRVKEAECFVAESDGKLTGTIATCLLYRAISMRIMINRPWPA